MNAYELISGINCTGCFACMNNCPQDAITIGLDQAGFFVPKINESSCVDCNKCYKQCPSRSFAKKNTPICSYVSYCQDDEIYHKSSSGGVFASIAKQFIDNNGVVYGACFDSNEQLVKHIRIESVNDVSKLQGSKYVQSYVGNIYRDVREKLLEGKNVLFSGTPCQIAGLFSVVDENKRTNLYTIDIICHGVSNNEMLKKSISGYRRDSYPIDIRFRNKSKFEKSAFSLRLLYDDGKTITVDAFRDLYYRLYIDGKNYRESCYSCIYATRERIGDITLGDCSTYKDYSDFSMEKSLSTVIINTNKGEELWQGMNRGLLFTKQNLERELSSNHQLYQPTKRPNDLMLVYSDYFVMPLKDLYRKYVDFDIKLFLMATIKRAIQLKTRIKIRTFIKRTLNR